MIRIEYYLTYNFSLLFSSHLQFNKVDNVILMIINFMI